MYIIDGIAYAEGFNSKNLKIIELKIVSDLCMLVTFSNGEMKIFDAKYLTQYDIYRPLENFDNFKNAYIENGIITWNNGAIDIGTETVYNNSYEYEQELAI